MAFTTFMNVMGTPSAGTGVGLADLQLEDHAGLRAFASEVGGGMFGGGFLSLLSVREAQGGLHGWEIALPDDSRLFGTTVFGTLLTTSGDDIWIVDTQYGQVVESNVPMVEFIDGLAGDDVREILRAEFFDAWREAGGELAPQQVLAPTPALALGGEWSVASLSTVSLPVYLSFTIQLFDDPDCPIEVRPVN